MPQKPFPVVTEQRPPAVEVVEAGVVGLPAPAVEEVLVAVAPNGLT